MRTYKWEDVEKDLLKNPEVKKEVERLRPEYELAVNLIKLRAEKKLTQKQLAEKINTSQPSIARIESGNYANVSLSYLRKIGEVLDFVPEIKFKRTSN